MIGFLIGLAAGAVQFFVLSRFARLITSKDKMIQAVAMGLIQFFIPVAVLVATGFLAKSHLLSTALGIVAVLVVGAFTRLIFSRKSRGREEKNG